MQFLDSIKDITKNYKRYDVWEQNQADDVAKRKYLSEKLDLPKDKVALTKSKAQAVFRASDMMDKRSEDNAADMEQLVQLASMAVTLPIIGAISYYPLYLAKKGKPMSMKQSTITTMVLPIILSIALLIWGNEETKKASRIGRFQAKKYELKDPKNFALFTPEQIKSAKNLAKNIPDKKDKKSISELFTNTNQMFKDRAEYKRWLEQRRNSNENEVQKILNKKFTPEQIAQGEEDKEIVVNIIKDVNNSAETYSENVENIFDTIGLLSFITNIPVIYGVNKILKKFKNISPVAKSYAPLAAGMLFTLPMVFWAAHEKKQGARVGRFVKRQEILDNPELIMAYSDEQFKQAKDIKAPKQKKGFWEKIEDNVKFFRKYIKDKKEYKKYKETTLRENEKLYDALQKIKVSEKQMKEARNLQEKTFMAFDKMDEMSQRYSQDMEVAGGIIREIITPIFGMLPPLIPLAVLLSLKKGKFPLEGTIKTASKVLLKKDSSFRTFITKANEVLNKDAGLKKDFSKILIDKKVQEKFINHPELQKLYMELISNNAKYLARINQAKVAQNTKEIENIAKEMVNENCRPLLGNLSLDISRLYMNIKKIKIKPVEKSKAIKDPFEIIAKFYNDYKTLSKTILLGGFVPIMGIAIGIPYVFASWLTNMQIKAGRIGVMKAMDEIDNPKLFVKTD